MEHTRRPERYANHSNDPRNDLLHAGPRPLTFRGYFCGRCRTACHISARMRLRALRVRSRHPRSDSRPPALQAQGRSGRPSRCSAGRGFCMGAKPRCGARCGPPHSRCLIMINTTALLSQRRAARRTSARTPPAARVQEPWISACRMERTLSLHPPIAQTLAEAQGPPPPSGHSAPVTKPAVAARAQRRGVPDVLKERRRFPAVSLSSTSRPAGPRRQASHGLGHRATGTETHARWREVKLSTYVRTCHPRTGRRPIRDPLLLPCAWRPSELGSRPSSPASRDDKTGNGPFQKKHGLGPTPVRRFALRRGGQTSQRRL